MAAATDETQIDWIELWKNEALVLAGNEQAAENLVRRVYEAGQADRHSRDAETINALEQELARLRRSSVTSGS
jgi:hypothetical protein